ncbi:hypothetical protein H6G80_28410 [Nostoc sp. FACHB-87]|uniref:hypothetical protein n=1 Tax=Nostocaceae TaxID=1162 RepID=UPI0016830030|nr:MULTISPECIES: hypothetical protein [Nostocaceae]MBD2457975.1 hypothetical protein [Nostoc sp. FACHB-87]MBD2479248.1 hypothetical protein [Anabaena sp. FACHB-83]
MTPEEITALVSQQIEAVKAELTQQITTANQGLAASLTKEIKKLSQPAPATQEEPEKESLTLKSLKQQLSDMQEQLAAKDRQALDAMKRSGVAEAIGQLKALSPGILQKLILTEYGDALKQDSGVWYVESPTVGVKPLATVLSDFLKTDDGKLFVPPSGINGSGATESKPIPATSESPKAEDLLVQAFSNPQAFSNFT